MTRPSPQTERVVALFDLMARHPDRTVTLSEVSRRLGVHRQSCYSMLQTLTDAGWLVRHPTRKTYRLGPGLVVLGRAAGTQSPILEYAFETMHALAADVDATVQLVHAAGDHIVIEDVANAPGRPPSPLAIGQRFPLRAPVGAVFVAWASPAAFDGWTGGADDDARHRFGAALDAVRARSYDVRVRTQELDLALDLRRRIELAGVDQEVDAALGQLVDRLIGHPDALVEIDEDSAYAVTAMSTPIADGAGEAPTYALSVAFEGSEPRRGREIARIGRRLVEAAEEISRAAGARHGVPLTAGDGRGA